MIQDVQEYLQVWEQKHNPFYPSEMRWDRLQVNRFLKDYKEQLIIHNVSQQRELLFCGGCGNKKQLIVETDINSQRVCKNKLCKQNNCG